MWVNDKPIESGYCDAIKLCRSDISTGRALHWHCRGQGLSPVQAFLLLLLSGIAKLQRSLTLKSRGRKSKIFMII